MNTNTFRTVYDFREDLMYVDNIEKKEEDFKDHVIDKVINGIIIDDNIVREEDFKDHVINKVINGVIIKDDIEREEDGLSDQPIKESINTIAVEINQLQLVNEDVTLRMHLKRLDSTRKFIFKHSPGRDEAIILVESILDIISTSVSIFRPSKSLAFISKQYEEEMLAADDYFESLPQYDEWVLPVGETSTFLPLGTGVEPSTPKETINTPSSTPKIPVAEIDLVISGGGLKGFFMCGAAHVLRKELAKRNIEINRIAGTSAGAWAGLFIMCGFSTHNWVESYYVLSDRPNETIHDVFTLMLPWLKKVLPENAYLLCSGRLFISITVITRYGLVNRLVSEFTSNDDLLQCCLASSTLPYLTESGGCRVFRGDYVVDGGLTNNIPVFVDGRRRQLVFRLFNVEYPWRLLVNAQDTCIDALIVRGAMLMARFLEGYESDSIVWLDKKQGKNDIIKKPGYWFRVGVIAPMTLIGIFLYRGTGVKELLHTLSKLTAQQRMAFQQ
jgi:hypothetical protein